MPSIVCIGGALVDRKYRLKGPAVPGSSNPAEASVAFGGVARNVADNLARLGVGVSLAAATGGDAAGAAIRDHLAKAGVDLSLLPPVAGLASAEYAAVLDHAAGGLVIAAAAMDAAEAAMDRRIDALLSRLPAAALVFADANLSTGALDAVAREARRSGRVLALDAVSVAKSRRLPASLQGVSVIVMNRDEAAAYLGVDQAPEHLAEMLRARGAGAAMVTSGADGATLADADGVHHAPAAPARTVDVTGAGDSLIAAVLWRIARGETPRQALPWGMAAAAATTETSETVHPAMSAAFLAARIAPRTTG